MTRCLACNWRMSRNFTSIRMLQFERDVLTYWSISRFRLITYKNILKFWRDVLTNDLYLAVFDFVAFCNSCMLRFWRNASVDNMLRSSRSLLAWWNRVRCSINDFVCWIRFTILSYRFQDAFHIEILDQSSMFYKSSCLHDSITYVLRCSHQNARSEVVSREWRLLL